MPMREAFKAAAFFTPKPVELPGGLRVFVRPLPYELLVRLRRPFAEDRNEAEHLVEVVAAGLCNEEGKPLFNYHDEEDHAALVGKPLSVLNSIAEMAIELSAADVAEAKKD